MRLIDADALKKEFGERRLDHDFCIPYDETTARKLIDDAETIDAEPVKHGKWIFLYQDLDRNINCECSICHHSESHSKEVYVPYCWFCGSKMDIE